MVRQNNINVKTVCELDFQWVNFLVIPCIQNVRERVAQIIVLEAQEDRRTVELRAPVFYLYYCLAVLSLGKTRLENIWLYISRRQVFNFYLKQALN